MKNPKIHWFALDCGDVKPIDNFTNSAGLVTCEKCKNLIYEWNKRIVREQAKISAERKT